MAVLQEPVDGPAVAQPTLLQRHPFAGLALAIALIVGAVWVLGGERFGEAVSDSTTVTLTGTQGGVAPKIGEPAPNVTLEALAGGTLSLEELQGRPVVINFWASWCPPCRGEMPDLESLAQEYRDAGLVVLGVNLEEDRPIAQRYADTLGLSFPIVLDRAGEMASRYNLTALPTTYFVDREGTIRDVNIGALTAKGLRSKVAKVVS
ncbi:MAG: TlpA family protein disulfide reductase [Chloroflexi bacterium]|nr:TlpA family protein disulfide reductase [Chloroflexota bacterium]